MSNGSKKIQSAIRYESDLITDLRKLSKISGVPKDHIVNKCIKLSHHLLTMKKKYPGWEKVRVKPLSGQDRHDVRDRTKDQVEIE